MPVIVKSWASERTAPIHESKPNSPQHLAARIREQHIRLALDRRGAGHGPAVAAIRKRTGKTQDQFAKAYRLPVGTVRDWEQSRSQPDAPARVLLSLIGAEPETIEQIVQRA